MRPVELREVIVQSFQTNVAIRVKRPARDLQLHDAAQSVREHSEVRRMHAVDAHMLQAHPRGLEQLTRLLLLGGAPAKVGLVSDQCAPEGRVQGKIISI